MVLGPLCGTWCPTSGGSLLIRTSCVGLAAPPYCEPLWVLYVGPGAQLLWVSPVSPPCLYEASVGSLWCLYVQPGSQHPAAPPLLLWRGFDNHVVVEGVLISEPLCGTCCSTILWTCIGPLWDYWRLGTSMWDWVFHHVSMGLWWVLYGGLGTPSLVGHGDSAPPCL